MDGEPIRGLTGVITKLATMINQRMNLLLGFNAVDIVARRRWRMRTNIFYPDRYVRFVMGRGDLLEGSQGEFETVMNRSILV